MDRRKILALWVFGGALLLLILLTGGVNAILLKQGTTLPFNLPRGTVRLGAGGGESPLLVTIIRGFLALMMVITAIYIIISLFTKEGRRRLLALALSIAAVFILLLFMQQILPHVHDDFGPTPSPFSDNPRGDVQITVIPQELPASIPSQPPPWLSTITSLVLALVLAGIVYGIYWLVQRSLSNRASPINRLGQEAQDAVERLNAGEDVRETVIRCYMEMNRIVQEERGILREDGETPREFVQSLVDEGLPVEPVRNLTRIFEMVRYGNVKVAQEKEKEAIACLTEIAEACKILGAKL